MDYKHIILTPQQLTEFKLGLKEGKLWSIIYTLLKEPDQWCGMVRMSEKENEHFDKKIQLSQSLCDTTSLLLAKISVDDKYRAYNAVKLIRNELIKDISIYDKIFIDSWCSIDKPISGKEKRIITDPLKFVINNGTITWNENFDERLNPTTDLYVIATMKTVKVTDKNDIIDAVLDEINDIDLGEYKNILLKRLCFTRT